MEESWKEYFKCWSDEQVKDLMVDLHDDICDNHYYGMRNPVNYPSLTEGA